MLEALKNTEKGEFIMTDKAITPRVDKTSLGFYPGFFQTGNYGYTYVLEAFPVLFGRALLEIRGKFILGELSLILDVSNGTSLTAGIAGQHIMIDVKDGITLDGLDKKWGIDGVLLCKKLQSLTSFQRACLEIWGNAYWYAGDRDRDPANIANYIHQLL